MTTAHIPMRKETGHDRAARPTVTVVITTKNRKDELRSAVASVLRQTLAVDLLIFDDGSTDGTSDFIRRAFPEAEFPRMRLERVEESLGIIRARNRALELASSDIVMTIDDDCVLVSPDTLQQTVDLFDDPRVAVVTIPIINVKQTPDHVGYRAPDEGVPYVTVSFGGGCNALRRDIFLKVGGYRGYLWRQGEEGDLAIRMLNQGYVVRLGTAAPMHHLESPVRDRRRIVYYIARSHMLLCWYNVPWTFLAIHLAASTVNVLRHGARHRCLGAALRGLAAGYFGIIHEMGRRRPVRYATYKAFRLLARQPMPLAEIATLKLPRAAAAKGAADSEILLSN